MNNLELKQLKDKLWHSADILRISANKYGQPILGLIFLRDADILFKQHKAEIDKEIFQSKTNLLMSVFMDKAIQGLRIA